MNCKKTRFRPLSCALCLLTAMAFIGLVCRISNLGSRHSSSPVYQEKQSVISDNFCFEQEEDSDGQKTEHSLHGLNKQTQLDSGFFISELRSIDFKAVLYKTKTKNTRITFYSGP